VVVVAGVVHTGTGRWVVVVVVVVELALELGRQYRLGLVQ